VHISLEFWKIIFHFSLFFLLFYKLCRFVIDFFLPYLHQQKHALKKKQVELLDKEKLVSSSLSKVKDQIQDQQKNYVLLKNKVKNCHENISAKNKLKKKEYKVTTDKIQERRELQKKNLSLSKALEKAIPKIISSATKELSSLYAGNN
jgi:hypothetical protein